MKKRIRIYTDGGCDRNPGGTGGWAYLITNDDKTVEESGREEKTTNNRMELTAAIRALQALKKPTDLEMLTDSQYLSRGISEWISAWIRHGWRLKDGSPVKNADLWRELVELTQKHRVTWTWIRGHSGDPFNMHVDKLVHEAIKGKSASTRIIPEKIAIEPEVKLVRRGGKYVGVQINNQPVDKSVKFRIEGIEIEIASLQMLIEALITAQREVEESS